MTDAAASSSLTCTLEGVSCAGCIAKIESHLAKQDGVILARGNATLKRMRLVWDPAQQSSEGLMQEIGSIGYKAHPFQPGDTAPQTPSLLPQLGVAAFATMNIMAISFAVWAGLATDMGPNSVQFMHWVSAFLATPVVFYSGAVFFRPSLHALSVGRMTMDTPISLAIAITYAASLFETLRGSSHVYFDAVTALIFFLLIGRVLERSLRLRSGDAAENLRSLMRLSARRVLGEGAIEEVDAGELMPGDIINVETGERVPADAVMLSAIAQVDESVITGETLPREVLENDGVAAGAIVVSGPARLRVSHVGEAAQIGRITQMIEATAAHKGPRQMLADRFARSYIPLVLVGGLVGFLFWYFVLGVGFADALMIAVAVLVVTCPCAAGLATPAVSSRAVNLLMRAGIVVKSGDALERLAEVTHVVSDKTGTLSSPLPVSNSPDSDIARHEAARLAVNSKHPLAQALCAGLKVAPAEGITEVPGQGMQAPSGARLGSARFVGARPLDQTCPTLWFRATDGTISRFEFAETAYSGIDDFLTGLGQMNLPLTLLSGDAPAAVKLFADKYGIRDWKAAAHPEEKLTHLHSMTGDGQKPLMFGDGINDAPALSVAHVSVSLASATEVAQVAADVVLTRPAPDLLPAAIKTAREARNLILQNLWFSAAYNVIAVPLALAGLLSPILAAILMSSSSIIVIANGLRLRGLK